MERSPWVEVYLSAFIDHAIRHELDNFVTESRQSPYRHALDSVGPVGSRIAAVTNYPPHLCVNRFPRYTAPDVTR